MKDETAGRKRRAEQQAEKEGQNSRQKRKAGWQMILIRGGRAIDPKSGRDQRADIVLDGNRIAQIL